MRRAGYWVAYGLVVGALGLGGAELLVRVLGLAPHLPNQYAAYREDPVLPHRLRPGVVLEGRSVTGEFDFHYAHNSHGMRDVERRLEKPAGVFRVLALGDSFTYGAGVGFEDTFLAGLERTLNQRDGSHPPVEVVKAGVPRYFPEAERLFLEHYAAPFDADLVLVVFVPNDVIDTYLGVDAIEVLPDGRLISNYGRRLLAQLGPGLLALYEHLHLARIPIRWVLQTRLRNEEPARWEEIYRAEGFHEEAWQEVEAHYTGMTDWARRQGTEIAFLHIPLRGPWDARHR
ncbi:MAG: SGNH/GDSL hydrolase family protein, partial [Myxococcota bacterium]